MVIYNFHISNYAIFSKQIQFFSQIITKKLYFYMKKNALFNNKMQFFSQIIKKKYLSIKKSTFRIKIQFLL